MSTSAVVSARSTSSRSSGTRASNAASWSRRARSRVRSSYARGGRRARRRSGRRACRRRDRDSSRPLGVLVGEGVHGVCRARRFLALGERPCRVGVAGSLQLADQAVPRRDEVRRCGAVELGEGRERLGRTTSVASRAGPAALPSRRSDGRSRSASRRDVRDPGHVLAEGVRPAHDAVSGPVRLLHLRQAAGPARCAVPHARRGPGHRPARRRARLPRGAVHARRGARGRGTRPPPSGSRPTVTPPPSTTSSQVAQLVLDETGLLPHANAGALSQAELERLRAVSPSQGMMIETLAARLARARRPAPRRARQDTRAPARDARGRGPRARAVHDRHPRRHRRDARGAHRSARSDRRVAPAARSRAGSHRPELPAEARHCDAQGRPVPARRVPVVDRGRARSSSPTTCTCRRRRTSATTSRRSSRPASTTGAASRRVTIDHVNPERPWPALDRLRDATEAAGHVLAPRLTIYPEYVPRPGRVDRSRAAHRGARVLRQRRARTRHRRGRPGRDDLTPPTLLPAAGTGRAPAARSAKCSTACAPAKRSASTRS